MGIEALSTGTGTLAYSASGTARNQKEATPEAQLEKYMKMTPAERMRDAILKKLGVTEEELAKMKPEEQKAMDEKIQELIKETLAKQEGASKQGVFIDTSA